MYLKDKERFRSTVQPRVPSPGTNIIRSPALLSGTAMCSILNYLKSLSRESYSSVPFQIADLIADYILLGVTQRKVHTDVDLEHPETASSFLQHS